MARLAFRSIRAKESSRGYEQTVFPFNHSVFDAFRLRLWKWDCSFYDRHAD